MVICHTTEIWLLIEKSAVRSVFGLERSNLFRRHQNERSIFYPAPGWEECGCRPEGQRLRPLLPRSDEEFQTVKEVEEKRGRTACSLFSRIISRVWLEIVWRGGPAIETLRHRRTTDTPICMKWNKYCHMAIGFKLFVSHKQVKVNRAIVNGRYDWGGVDHGFLCGNLFWPASIHSATDRSLSFATIRQQPISQADRKWLRRGNRTWKGPWK